MSPNWIGIADDLTEQGVVGRPYVQPAVPPSINAAISRQAVPSRWRRKIVLIVGIGLLATGLYTPQGKSLFVSIKKEILAFIYAPEAKPIPSSDGNSLPVRAAPPPTPSMVVAAPPPPVAAPLPEPAKNPIPSLEKTPDPSGGQGKAMRATTEYRTPPSKQGALSQPAKTTNDTGVDSEVDLNKYRAITGRI